MAVFRAFLLILALAGFFLIGVPLQWLALRFGWPLRHWMPAFFSRTLCALLRVRVHFHGDLQAHHPRLIVANHVSWLDILTLGVRDPMCFLAKHEVADWPGFGALAKLQGSIFVNRQRRMGLPLVNARMAQKLIEGENVVLFAEATTSDGTVTKKFHAVHIAAARDLLRQHPEVASVTVQPVAIAYTRCNGVPLGRAGRAGIAWYGDLEMAPHLWFMLNTGPVECHIFCGKALQFDRSSERKAVARQLERAVRGMVGRALSGRLSTNEADNRKNPDALPVLLGAKTS